MISYTILAVTGLFERIPMSFSGSFPPKWQDSCFQGPFLAKTAALCSQHVSKRFLKQEGAVLLAFTWTEKARCFFVCRLPKIFWLKLFEATSIPGKIRFLEKKWAKPLVSTFSADAEVEVDISFSNSLEMEFQWKLYFTRWNYFHTYNVAKITALINQESVEFKGQILRHESENIQVLEPVAKDSVPSSFSKGRKLVWT